MKYARGLVVVIVLVMAAFFVVRYLNHQAFLEKVIQRLQADSRAAEVMVVGVNYNEESRRNFTTIKFLEYDTSGKPLEPKYFTFPGNIIQFQSLVVRFDEKFVMSGDRLKGKSVYLFWKAFMLDGKDTKEFPITEVESVPQGYKVPEDSKGAQEEFWRNFWAYALDKEQAERAGIRNVQIEAPGTMFVPGYVYTIRIEHDGGLRIDTIPIPTILQGEKVM